MLKVVGYLKRKPGMPVEAFQKHWLDVYGPMIARLPGLRRYVQSHTLINGYRKGEPIYDGFAELWFDDEAAYRNAAQSDEMAKAQRGREDFMDESSLGVALTQEHVIKDTPVPAGAVKNIEFVTRKPGMPVADFQRHWRVTHGPLGASIPVVLRYVQSHPLASEYENGKQPQWDGFPLTWFESTNAMRHSATTPEYAATRADEPNFIAPVELPIIITKEHVIVG
jgi:uncharacterized protein (TIGR02118 family)